MTRSAPAYQLLGLVLLAVSEASAQPATPSLACAASTTTDIYLVGQGQCVDQVGNTSSAFTCQGVGCPTTFTADSCALACVADDGCTGFDLRTNATTGLVGCFIFVTAAPVYPSAAAPWPFVAVPGLQPLAGRVVAASNSAADSCCYKHAYPRPNPTTNPLQAPPPQSDVQKAVFANKTAQAAAASNAALPALTALIDFCAANATVKGVPFSIFGPTECPGMADLIAGTTAPYPTTAQILARFDLEVCPAMTARAPACSLSSHVGPLVLPTWSAAGCICIAEFRFAAVPRHLHSHLRCFLPCCAAASSS